MKININDVLRSSVGKERVLRASCEGQYKAANFKKSILVENVLVYQLYGEKDVRVLWASWVPLLLEIVSKGKIFNWASIWLANINQAIKMSIGWEDKLKSNFFTASYLLDDICVG